MNTFSIINTSQKCTVFNNWMFELSHFKNFDPIVLKGGILKINEWCHLYGCINFQIYWNSVLVGESFYAVLFPFSDLF